MSMLSREKFRSAGVGLAMLAGVFFASSSGAQENNPDTPEHDEAPIRMTLPNLTTHPLAGGTVMQRLCAEDGMGERSCENVEVFIAPPALENPIGKILHKLRRDLAVDDLNAAPGVIVSIQDILDTQAENFANPESLTRLSEIQQDLESGVETQDLSVLDKAVQDLWRLILQLEDDMRSEAEKALEDALEALKDALEEGASEEELKELRELAEEAMEDFLNEQLEDAEANEMSPEEKAAMEEMQKLMEEMQKMMEEMQLSEEQMAEMMKQMMEQAQQAQQGQQGQAGQQGEQQEMDYQKMLEQMKQQMQQMQQMQKMQQNMDELKELMEDQQELRDDTFSDALKDEALEQEDDNPPAADKNQQQNQQPQQQNPEKSGQPQQQQNQNGLAQQQKDVNERLQDLMQKMRQEGMDPGELDRADNAMRRARQDLENGQEGQAVPDQDEALESMNEAQQQMQQQMQQMMQQMMPGEGGPKSGQMPGGPAMSRPQSVPGVDNDGRIRESNNPNDILDVSPGEGGEAQRDVRDKIRKRMQQGGNEYLENLLESNDAPSAPGQ